MDFPGLLESPASIESVPVGIMAGLSVFPLRVTVQWVLFIYLFFLGR